MSYALYITHPEVIRALVEIFEARWASAVDPRNGGVPLVELSRREQDLVRLLAEKGLPTSASSGYELFDKLGPVGLTSFMQEVTRVRALEGEIGRSIQQIDGVAAARAVRRVRPGGPAD